MKTKDAIRWFKVSFHRAIEDAMEGLPFSVDMVAAIAYQETGYLWSPLVDRLPVDELLKVCVGDTIDAPNRSAFPKTKTDLLNASRGDEMFRIAREALVAIGRFDSGYAKIANNRPNKFCHGFGIFQYDVQFYKTNPDFFLEKKWYDFSECLAIFID